MGIHTTPHEKTRENWDSLVSGGGDFWMIWKCHDIPWIHFYFLLRNNSKREKVDENEIRYCYGKSFFESVIPKIIDHNYVQSSFSTIAMHLDNGIWKTPYNWRFYGREATQVPNLTRHLSYNCMLLIRSIKPILKSNLVLIE